MHFIQSISKRLIFILLIVTIIAPGLLFAKATITFKEARCEYKTNPLGIDTELPRLSWKLESSARDVSQSAYEIRVATSVSGLKKANVWNSGKITSDQSIQVVYGGPALTSSTRYFWQVRVWDAAGNASEWSAPAWWETGLLEKSDWKASWITPTLNEDTKKSNPSPMLRKDFTIPAKIKNARVYITSMGLYELYINGVRVGDQVLTPGWTSMEYRIQYQTYDVTGLLQQGNNAAGVFLGDGWFRGNLGFRDQRNTYGDKLALLFQLAIELENGQTEIVTSDNTWKSATGPILSSDIYQGQVYDARLEKTGWNKPGYKDSDWAGVETLTNDVQIKAPDGPAVRKIEEIKPVKLIKTPKGETVVDFGQNMVGWVRFTVNGKAGDTVTLYHAEVLDKEGNFYITNLRSAKQLVQYTLKGGAPETWEPQFTFQGFRFVKIEGWPGEVNLNDLTGVVVHSDITPTGSFVCSNPMINQLQHNILWGQKGNFVDVPTDCPQRDERLGWTGDAQAFSRTACFNADVAGFYTKWLKDLALDQKQNGAIPHVIPNILDRKNPTSESGATGWADAGVIVPWTVYLCYGDIRILESQYKSVCAWVNFMREQAGDNYLWQTGYHFGDWLAFNSTSSDYPGATTDKDLLATAFFANSTSLAGKIAEILGKTDDAEKFAALHNNIKKAFQKEYITPNGRLSSNTQTAYSVALAFDLLPAELAPKAAQRLAEDVKKFGHITTGFLGTPLICHVLSDYGYTDLAYMLLNRTQYPSWLYPITMGATTIWERWDGIKPDGSFQDAGMNSFNHYAYGAIGDWLYRVVAGLEIDPKKPAYKHIIIKPEPGGELTSAKAVENSMYGQVASGWEKTGNTMKISVEIPVNTSAQIILPDAKLDNVTESGKSLQKAKGLHDFTQKENTVVINAGSGKYEFSYEL